MSPVVIRFGRLGDTLLLQPLLERLHRGYGEPCTLLGTGPWSGQLYAGHPDVARVLQIGARHRPLPLSGERLRMLWWLRAQRDVAVHVCESEPRALAKIRRMLALARIAPGDCVYLTDAPERTGEHWVDRLLRACGHVPSACVDAWCEPSPVTTPAPSLRLRDEDRADCASWLGTRGWRGEHLWLVQPCNKRSIRWNGARRASDDAKAWPMENWVMALRAMRAQHPDARIVLCGAPREAPGLESIARVARLGNLDVAARDLPLRRLLALAERAAGMLSVDTGPAHVAAAMGCPLVVLFGGQSPRVWCPRSPSGSAVIALGGPPARSWVAEITPNEVIDALQRLPRRPPRDVRIGVPVTLADARSRLRKVP